MARIRLAIGTRYRLGNQVFRLNAKYDDNYAVENLTSGAIEKLSYSHLLALWQSGELQFELSSTSPKPSAGQTQTVTEYTIADFQSLPQTVRVEAWRRYNLLLPLLKLSPGELTRHKFQEYAAQLQIQLDTGLNSDAERELARERRNEGKRAAIGQAIGYSSLEKWFRNFQSSGYDIRSLVPRTKESGGKGRKRLDGRADQLLDRVFEECAANLHYRTVDDIFARLANLIAEHNRLNAEQDRLDLPSPATVYRRLKEKRLEHLLRRKPSAKEQQTTQNVKLTPKPLRPLERVEIDHTCLDLLVVDEQDRLPIGRPTLTVALDVYSGNVFGCYVSFEPPSYQSVQLCLLHGILPKPDYRALYGTKNEWVVYGLPEILVVDNGKEFRGQDLEAACAQLGITLVPTPVRKPWFKGSIERYFQTLNTGLIHPLPGTTFSNVLQRGEYDPSAHACISLTAFRQMLHVFLLDVYAQRWHSGLEAVPAKRWQESLAAGFTPTLPHSAQEVRILLLRSAERKIGRSGIEFEALCYQNSELSRMRSELGSAGKVRLKYDPADLSHIYLADKGSPNGWLKVEAVDQDYTRNLSLWKHRVIREYVLREKREVNPYELAKAKEFIGQIAAQEFEQTRSQRGRKVAARVLGSEREQNLIRGGTVNARQNQNRSGQPQPQETDSHPTVITELESPNVSGNGVSKEIKQQELLPQGVGDDFTRGSGWGGDYDLPDSSLQRLRR